MSGSRGTVLVVEDDRMIRLLLERVLADSGFEVLLAGDGETGLDLAREHLPDAALLDIGLPGISGLEVLERLRADPLLARIPAIMVTAWGDSEYVERARLSGAHDYIRKPFDATELIARVEGVVSIKASRDAQRAGAPAAEVDALTGLPLPGAVELSGDVVVVDAPWAAITIKHGRAAAETMLCDVAARLRETVAGADLVRWSEARLVVAPGTRDLAERVRAALSEPPLTIPGGRVAEQASVTLAAAAEL